MEMPVERWYKAIQKRRSRRTFISKPIEDTSVWALMSMIEVINGWKNGTRLAYVDKSIDNITQNAVGPYGRVTGAPAYIAVIVNNHTLHKFEKAGMTGEAIVLEITSLGLSTCWIGGSFHHSRAAEEIGIEKDEAVIAVLPVGHARKNYSLQEKMMQQRGDFLKRKPLEDLVEGLEVDQWSNWQEAALNAARLAPTAYNRQASRFIVEKNTITIYIDNPGEQTNVPKEIDCGIAMLHIQLAAKVNNCEVVWEYLDYPQVAVFKK